MHATYGPLFGKLSDEAKAAQLAKLADKLTKLEAMLGSKPFLNGDKFTISDCCKSKAGAGRWGRGKWPAPATAALTPRRPTPF